MARRVFFSFHYENDCRRAAQVRNSNVITNNSIESPGFVDSAKWEEIKRQGDDSIKCWICNQMEGTSVTVVLIGSKTVDSDGNVRPWIQYEISESVKRGNGLLGIYIHNCNDPLYGTDIQGKNPFHYLHFTNTGELLSTKYRTYDWINERGRDNLGNWIERAYKDVNTY